MPTPTLATLARLASSRQLARVVYRKHISPEADPPRVIEPYNLTPGQNDLMLRCYQVQPDEGWRFLMLSRIVRVEDAGRPFQPRVRVTISPEDLPEGVAPAAAPADDRVARYRSMVSEALADDTVTREEFERIRAFVDRSGLTVPEMQFVHAELFHACLGAIIEDGRIDAHERAQIRFLHRVLGALGWSVID